MSGHRAGGLKARDKIYEKYGKDWYVTIGRKGGQNGNTGGFVANPNLAVLAGRKGGRLSSRRGIKNGEGKKRLKGKTNEN